LARELEIAFGWKLNRIEGFFHVDERLAFPVLLTDPDHGIAENLEVLLLDGGHVAGAHELLDECLAHFAAKAFLEQAARRAAFAEAGDAGIAAQFGVLLIEALRYEVVRHRDGQLLAERTDVLDLDA